MKGLLVFAVVLVVVGVVGFMVGAVVWLLLSAIPPSFENEDPDDGEQTPQDPDRPRDQRITDEMGVL